MPRQSPCQGLQVTCASDRLWSLSFIHFMVNSLLECLLAFKKYVLFLYIKM